MFNKESISNLDTSNVKEVVKIDKALNEITKAGKGELQLTDAVVNYFMQYVRGRHLKYPVDFYVATDGTNAIYWFCSEGTCRESDSVQSIKICEKELGKKCKKFAVRRTIKWKNGINPGKGKASKISSKWSDAEIYAKLTELGFYKNEKKIDNELAKNEKNKKEVVWEAFGKSDRDYDATVEVPILLKLICLNNSPKPSIVLSAISSIASGVESRPVKPVPPVVIMASILRLVAHDKIVFFIKVVSSLIICLSYT